ncbi:RHS repeat domain-containing protein [Microbulbifer echini]|uniref:RHS repeat domain-containing protein n=1 Tax=Microbulbifer echini TaxID=1529067 RepID=A0ABV4NUI8_9GAMM
MTPDGITNFRYNRSGQLTEAENAHRKLRWEYDANGRVVADWQGKEKLSHQYDAVGNRIATTLPDGEVLNFAFNPVGQFQSLYRRPVGGDTDYLITSISHDEQGRERQHGNGLESQRDYDPQGRLQKLRLGKANGPVSDPTQSNSILERRYQYNKAGQIAQIEDSLRGTRSYHYDALDRLTQVDGPNPEYFVHDPAHNILAAANSKDEAKQQASATQVKGNRLAFRGDTHYRYDIHGNRIAELRGKGQKLQTRYHYNNRQQLACVEKLKVENGTEQFQQVIHYQYDPLGRRIGKASESEQTDFLWDGDVLLQENKVDIQTLQDLNTRTYYFEPGTFKPVGLKENKQDKEQVYHYHLDHLGTPDTLTNQDGEVVWSVAYKSYGNIALAHENQIEQPIRFQGQYFDEETGLHYNRFRYYDPQVGEFTQQDPIGLLGGVNNYRYVPNPVTWIDPLGLSSKDCPPKQAPERKNKPSLFGKIKSLFTGKSEKTNSAPPPPKDTVVQVDKGTPVAIINGKAFDPTVMHGKGFHGMRIPEGMSIDDLFANGLPAKSNNNDLISHANGGEDSAFRGTAPFIKSPMADYGGPIDWADEGGIVVKIEGAPMFNVNELLEGRVENAFGGFGGNRFTAEAENAVFADVKSEHIKAIAKVKEGPRGRLELDEWIENPNFGKGPEE